SRSIPLPSPFPYTTLFRSLGEGARYATLCLTQSATGCAAPTAAQVKTKINASVYGIGPGTFTVSDPVSGTSGTASYYDLTVSYSQPTNLLMFPGPTMSLSRSKRVWVATSSYASELRFARKALI